MPVSYDRSQPLDNTVDIGRHDEILTESIGDRGSMEGGRVSILPELDNCCTPCVIHYADPDIVSVGSYYRA